MHIWLRLPKEGCAPKVCANIVGQTCRARTEPEGPKLGNLCIHVCAGYALGVRWALCLSSPSLSHVLEYA
eukprot:4948150-Karenia_brevis.AAC.1